jgi:hypothetical protein
MSNFTGKTRINTPQGAMTVREAVEAGICEVVVGYYLSYDETHGNCVGRAPRWKCSGIFYSTHEKATAAIHSSGCKVVRKNELCSVATGVYYRGTLSDRTAESLFNITETNRAA